MCDPRDEATDIENLRQIAGKVKDILGPISGVLVVQDDWFEESPQVKLQIDPDRANLAGITIRDVAASATAGIGGVVITTLREGNRQIPVVVRLLPQERARLAAVEDLYVYSSQGPQKIPLRSVPSITNEMVTERFSARHFRTIGVHAFPQPGIMPSEI